MPSYYLSLTAWMCKNVSPFHCKLTFRTGCFCTAGLCWSSPFLNTSYSERVFVPLACLLAVLVFLLPTHLLTDTFNHSITETLLSVTQTDTSLSHTTHSDTHTCTQRGGSSLCNMQFCSLDGNVPLPGVFHSPFHPLRDKNIQICVCYTYKTHSL